MGRGNTHDRASCRPGGAFGGIQVALFSHQVAEPGKGRSGNAVARGEGIVHEVPAALDQLFVIMGCKVESAVLPVLKSCKQRIG